MKINIETDDIAEIFNRFGADDETRHILAHKLADLLEKELRDTHIKCDNPKGRGGVSCDNLICVDHNTKYPVRCDECLKDIDKPTKEQFLKKAGVEK